MRTVLLAICLVSLSVSPLPAALSLEKPSSIMSVEVAPDDPYVVTERPMSEAMLRVMDIAMNIENGRPASLADLRDYADLARGEMKAMREFIDEANSRLNRLEKAPQDKRMPLAFAAGNFYEDNFMHFATDTGDRVEDFYRPYVQSPLEKFEHDAFEPFHKEYLQLYDDNVALGRRMDRLLPPAAGKEGAPAAEALPSDQVVQQQP